MLTQSAVSVVASQCSNLARVEESHSKADHLGLSLLKQRMTCCMGLMLLVCCEVLPITSSAVGEEAYAVVRSLFLGGNETEGLNRSNS